MPHISYTAMRANAVTYTDTAGELWQRYQVMNLKQQDRRMYVDFGDLKKDLKEIVDYLDHCLIIETGSLKETTLKALQDENFRIIQFAFRPTAENMAKYFYDKMSGRGYKVKQITVYETPNNSASYTQD